MRKALLYRKGTKRIVLTIAPGVRTFPSARFVCAGCNNRSLKLRINAKEVLDSIKIACLH